MAAYPLAWLLAVRLAVAALAAGLCSAPAAAPASEAPARLSPELVVQTGHSAIIHAVATSADSRWVASGGADNVVRLWDLRSGHEVRALSGHRGAVQAVSFSRDGRLLASAGTDRLIKIWELASGRELYSLEGHTDAVSAVAFTPDARTLVSGAMDDTLRIWDVASGVERRRITIETTGSAWRGSLLMALSPDGRTIASGGLMTQLWDAANGRLLRTLRPLGAADARPDWAIAFSPDGRRLAVSGRTMQILDTTSGAALRESGQAGAGTSTSLAFTPDGRFLVGAGSDVVVWDTAVAEPARVLADVGRPGARVALSPDGRRVIVGAGSTRDFAVRVLSRDDGRELQRLAGRTSPLTSIAFASDGRLLAAGHRTNIARTDTVKLWDLQGGQMLSTLSGIRVRANDVAFSRDARTLASGGGVQIHLYDVVSGQRRREIDDKGGQVDRLAYSADGKRLASGERNGAIRLWDAASGERLRELRGHTPTIHALAFSPDGSLLASGGRDRMVRLWDPATGALLREVGHANAVTSVAFSADGRLLASSGVNQPIVLSDARTGQPVRTLSSDAGATHAVVDSLAFSPDGQWLAASVASENPELGGVFLWELASGRPRGKLAGSAHAGNAVAFSPDGRVIAAGSRDASIRLWDTERGELLATLLSLDGEDWLVAAPDGLFDGTPAAWNRMLWRFSPQLLDLAPVETFFNEYYRPGLLAEIMAGQRPRAPQRIERKDRRQPEIRLSLAGPAGAARAAGFTGAASTSSAASTAGAADPLSAATPRVKLAIEVSSAAAGATDLRLFRNGSLVQVWRGDVLAGSTRRRLETEVTITAGANRFSAYAFNRDNVKSTDAVLEITGDASLARRGVVHLLAIGINRYANAQFDLAFAVADANEFAAQFGQQQARLPHYEKVHTVSLLDQEATRAAILQALERIASLARPEDAVVVYYAGHGTAEQQRFYLIPHDLGFAGRRDRITGADIATVLAHSISDRDLERAFERVNAGRVLLVIDACNSGQALEAAERRRGPMNSKGLAQLAYEKGMVVLAAAQSYQAAIEPADLKHGLLTYALVEEGLKRAKADFAPKDGSILLREWLDFATARVPQLQLERMQGAASRNVALAYVEGEEKLADASRRNVQRPRVFYRRDIDSQPFVVLGATADAASAPGR